ncbi:MAG: TonB-dependent receptor [Myxococcales bacterium]|nr:TonB-dependent receptor [Myxococcales bacterium]
MARVSRRDRRWALWQAFLSVWALRGAWAQGVPEGEGVVRGRGALRGASDTLIEAERYRAVPRASAAEFLTLAPGFFLSQHGGEGKAHQLFLRGFDAQHGQDVAFSVGGLPVNEVSNVHGQGYADLNFIIPEVIDTVRVIEGPFDPRQGDFAVAGSAQFELGVRTRGSFLRGSVGMFGTTRVAAVMAPRGAERETFAAAELYRTAGYGQNRAASRASAMAQYARPFGEHARVRLLVGSYATRFDAPGVVRVDDYEAGRVGFFDSYDTAQGGATGRHFMVGELTHQDGAARTQFSVSASLRDFAIRENFTGQFLDLRGDRYSQRYEAGTVGVAASHRVAGAWRGRTQSLEFGFNARHDTARTVMERLRTDGEGAYLRQVDADLGVTDIALWLDTETRPFARLALRLGARADALWFNIDDHLPRTGSTVPRGPREAEGLAVGPRASATLALGRGVECLAALGRGFRSPQATTLGRSERAPFAVVDAAELGLRWRRGGRALHAEGFVTRVDRDLVFDPPSGQNLVNEASAATTRVGASVAFEGPLAAGLALSTSLTWARATYDATGFLVPYVPPVVGRADLTWERRLGQLRGLPLTVGAALGSTLLGPRPLPFSMRSDAVFLLDLAVSLRLSRVALGLSARNLTDARWRDGTFSYASWFDPRRPESLVPVEHFTAGRPFTLLSTLTVYL